jgi:hypothetical protein
MTNPQQPGFGTDQGGADVNRLHDQDDRDISVLSHHHTLGIFPAQASPGDHLHDGKQSKKIPASNITGLPAVVSPSITLPVSEQGYGLVPVIGVSLTYARSDHSHGSPLAPVRMQSVAASAAQRCTTANVDMVGLTTNITTTKDTAFIYVEVTLDIDNDNVLANNIVTGQLVLNGVAQAGEVRGDGRTIRRDGSSQSWGIVVGAITAQVLKVQIRQSIAPVGPTGANIQLTHSKMTVLIVDI